VKQKTKEAVTKVIIREAKKLPKEKFLSITVDN
jgi:IS30 family transposase